MPVYLKNSFGDMLVNINVKIPSNITEEQKKLLIQLKKLSNSSNKNVNKKADAYV